MLLARNRYQAFEESAASVGGFSQWCSSCNKTTDPHFVYNAWLSDGTPVFGQPAALWCVHTRECARVRAQSCSDHRLGKLKNHQFDAVGIHNKRGSATKRTAAMEFDPQPRASKHRLTALRGTCAPLHRIILSGRCLFLLMVLTTVREPSLFCNINNADQCESEAPPIRGLLRLRVCMCVHVRLDVCQ